MIIFFLLFFTLYGKNLLGGAAAPPAPPPIYPPGRHNGGTSGAPLKPLRDDSTLRALSSLRSLRGYHSDIRLLVSSSHDVFINESKSIHFRKKSKKSSFQEKKVQFRKKNRVSSHYSFDDET